MEDGEGRLPLLCAVEKKSPEIVKLLLRRATRETDPSPLHSAEKLVNQTNRSGQSALVMAAMMGNAEVVALLLEHGADPNQATTDDTGQELLPIQAAVIGEDYGCIWAIGKAIGPKRSLQGLAVARDKIQVEALRFLVRGSSRDSLQTQMAKMRHSPQPAARRGDERVPGSLHGWRLPADRVQRAGRGFPQSQRPGQCRGGCGRGGGGLRRMACKTDGQLHGRRPLRASVAGNASLRGPTRGCEQGPLGQPDILAKFLPLALKASRGDRVEEENVLKSLKQIESCHLFQGPPWELTLLVRKSVAGAGAPAQELATAILLDKWLDEPRAMRGPSPSAVGVVLQHCSTAAPICCAGQRKR